MSWLKKTEYVFMQVIVDYLNSYHDQADSV